MGCPRTPVELITILKQRFAPTNEPFCLRSQLHYRRFTAKLSDLTEAQYFFIYSISRHIRNEVLYRKLQILATAQVIARTQNDPNDISFPAKRERHPCWPVKLWLFTGLRGRRCWTCNRFLRSGIWNLWVWMQWRLAEMSEFDARRTARVQWGLWLGTSFYYRRDTVPSAQHVDSALETGRLWPRRPCLSAPFSQQKPKFWSWLSTTKMYRRKTHVMCT